MALSRTAHAGQVRTLVAHEPPVIGLPPDSAQLRAQIQDIYDTYGADGADTAMAKFMAHVGLDEAPHADAPGWGTLAGVDRPDARPPPRCPSPA